MVHILVPAEGLDSEEVMKLDPDNIQNDPGYIRELIGRAGITQKQAAASVGVAPRTIANWLSGEAEWSYPAQYALECLVKYGVKK